MPAPRRRQAEHCPRALAKPRGSRAPPSTPGLVARAAPELLPRSAAGKGASGRGAWRSRKTFVSRGEASAPACRSQCGLWREPPLRKGREGGDLGRRAPARRPPGPGGLGGPGLGAAPSPPSRSPGSAGFGETCGGRARPGGFGRAGAPPSAHCWPLRPVGPGGAEPPGAFPRSSGAFLGVQKGHLGSQPVLQGRRTSLAGRRAPLGGAPKGISTGGPCGLSLQCPMLLCSPRCC